MNEENSVITSSDLLSITRSDLASINDAIATRVYDSCDSGYGVSSQWTTVFPSTGYIKIDFENKDITDEIKSKVFVEYCPITSDTNLIGFKTIISTTTQEYKYLENLPELTLFKTSDNAWLSNFNILLTKAGDRILVSIDEFDFQDYYIAEPDDILELLGVINKISEDFCIKKAQEYLFNTKICDSNYDNYNDVVWKYDPRNRIWSSNSPTDPWVSTCLANNSVTAQQGININGITSIS